MDVSQYAKKQTPAQQRERLQWQLDAIRENQAVIAEAILFLAYEDDVIAAQSQLRSLYKSDRDAILQPGGIFTDEQLKILSPERFAQDTETDK